MGCNCKRAAELVDDYGVPTEETVLEKVSRGLFKLIIFLIMVVLGIVVCPVIILIAIYKMTFGKGGIRIPHKVFEMVKKADG